MAPPLYPGTGATYQGIPCQSAAFTVPFGVASGHGSIVVPQTEWVRRFQGDPWKPHGEAGGSKAGFTSIRGATDASADQAALSNPLEIRGPLVFSRGGDTVTLPRIYVAEAGCEDERRSDEAADRGLIRVQLADVRHLWSRGDVHGEYNILKSRKGINPAKRGTVVVNANEVGDFEPWSVKPSGEAYNLLDLVQLCMSRLPGGVRLVESAESERAKGLVPANLRYVGESASSVLSELCAAWNFRLVYDPVADVCSLWRFGEGAPKHAEQGATTLSLSFGSVAINERSVRNRSRRTQFHYRPKSVRVLGKKIIREVVRELELCGELDGEVVPLAVALAGQKPTFNIHDAARWVLLPPEMQSAWRGGIPDTTVTELRRWCFRWARLNDGDRAGFPPILPYRARSMVDGSRRVPVVWADLYGEESYATWKKKIATTKDEIRLRARATIERLTSELSQAEQARLRLEVRQAGALAGFLDGESPLDLEAPLAEPELSRYDANLRRIQDDLLAQLRAVQKDTELAIAATEEGELRQVNRPFAKIDPAIYNIDDQGVVRFRRLVGLIDSFPGPSLDPAAPLSNLTGAAFGGDNPRAPTKYVLGMQAMRTTPPPSIRMLFAYESSPLADLRREEVVRKREFDKSADYRDYYNVLGGRDAKGKVVILNPAGEEPAAGSAKEVPRVVRHDLRQWIDIDGRTNKNELDAFAVSVIRRELEGPDQSKGEVGESASYYPIACTGAVSEVGWELASNGRAKTTWNVGVDPAIERQQTQIRIPGTGGLGTGPGSMLNPNVGGKPE